MKQISVCSYVAQAIQRLFNVDPALPLFCALLDLQMGDSMGST